MRRDVSKVEKLDDGWYITVRFGPKRRKELQTFQSARGIVWSQFPQGNRAEVMLECWLEDQLKTYQNRQRWLNRSVLP